MKRRRCLLLCVFATSSVLAAEPLGRLFYTPAERARMEKTQPEPDAATRYQGVVESSGGQRIIWVDGRPQPDEAGTSERKTVGGAQDELLRGGRIIVHPKK
ncbi:MAG: hypothetical protein LBQ81_02830 [Zoogloeaceae bacterium]|jgi:hypothetical protein|nr:hypothetical protein [Zoogloeaceae bacterium]